jgi:hypothetical protein
MKVLFCGGPVNGQWREMDIPRLGHSQWVEVVAPPTPLDMRRGTGTLTKVKYRLWPISILGHHLWVAAVADDHNESDSVLYAILQRDVADHLRGRA